MAKFRTGRLSKKIITILIITFIAISPVLLTACGKTNTASKQLNTLYDLKGCKFALSDGNSSYEKSIEDEIPGVKFERYTNYFDTFIAVANGNADAAFAFKYTFYGIKKSYPNLEYVESNIQIPIVASFSKENNELKKDLINLFLRQEKMDY